ncbi:MAG: hypothetical protein OK474_02490 [Thaumarchaeota archaeon]|nr:hypothetical protein [Nitrososphaerota archaeon]
MGPRSVPRWSDQRGEKSRPNPRGISGSASLPTGRKPAASTQSGLDDVACVRKNAATDASASPGAITFRYATRVSICPETAAPRISGIARK